MEDVSSSALWGSSLPFSVMLAIFILTVLAVIFCLCYHDLILAKLNPLPPLNEAFPFEDHTWTFNRPDDGHNHPILPWKLTAPEADLEDLQERLQKTRYGRPMEGKNFEYGFPGDQLKKVVDYWLNDFDWKKQEALINQYPNFKTTIEGLQIHFVRVRPATQITEASAVKVLPIMALHGWPGSFFELYKLIPALTTPKRIGYETIVFEVIIPSLPGFGFSEGAQKQGLGPRHMARILHKLMVRLQFPKYFVQGSDFGNSVGRAIAIMYPEHVSGLAITMYPIPMGVAILKSLISAITPAWLWKIKEPQRLFFKTFPSFIRESGYMHIQATKPDTVAAALLSDPAGLAAYILEKFSTWTNADNIHKPDGGLREYFTLDELLTNVMIYWTSGSIITSMRLYKEMFGGRGFSSERFPILVPTLLSDFANELTGANPPNAFVKPFYRDLVGISKHAAGGHFPSLERPEDVAADVWTLVKIVRLREQ